MANLLNKLDCDLVNYPGHRDEIERRKSKYKWICCDTLVTTGFGTGGCKKGKHFCGEQIERGQQRQDEYRLHQITIEQWENKCRYNQEYNDRWLFLLRSRI